MRLRCYFPAEEALAFSISVESDADVQVARQRIFRYLKDEGQLHDIRRSSDLRLYKARIFPLPQVLTDNSQQAGNIPVTNSQLTERCRQWLHSQPDTANLAAGSGSWTELVDLFPGGPPKHMIHIIVADEEGMFIQSSFKSPCA